MKIGQTFSYWLPIELVIIMFSNALFNYLIRAPTIKGRELIMKIKGFKKFLTSSDKEILSHIDSLENAPEFFNKYLPYAYVLDVLNKWSDKFKGIFNTLQKKNSDLNEQIFKWYTGAFLSLSNLNSFSTNLSISIQDTILGVKLGADLDKRESDISDFGNVILSLKKDLENKRKTNQNKGDLKKKD